MKHVFRPLFAATLTFVATAVVGTSALAFDGWHQESSVTIAGKGTAWDYLSFDSTNNRLFVGRRKGGLQVVDVASGKMIKVVGNTAESSSNGAMLVPEFDLGVSYNENGTLTPFKLSTLEAQPDIKLGDELDATHYDPATKRIFVNGAKEGELLVLEAPSMKQVGAVKVTTKKPEHAEADGKGNFYLASRDENSVYRIDTREMKVTAQWPTPGCAQTNGLALDVANNRIFLGCRGNATVKPSFVVMNAETGAIIYNFEIGGGNDSVVYDADLKRIFVAGSVNALMNVFEQVDANTYKAVEALGTQAGLRTLAMDHKTKKIYAITGEGSADYSKKITTSVSPYYANTFFPDRFFVLTYSK